MNHTPAEIIHKSLLTAGLGTDPTLDQDWPLFFSYLPEKPFDKALAVFDTQGVMQGRAQETVCESYGIMLRIRSTTYAVGRTKGLAIVSHLDGIKRESITLDSTIYTVFSFRRTSNLLSMGREPEGRQRENFSINGTISIEVSS